MSKELATYFSPFAPIQQFSQETLFKQPQAKEGIIDVQKGLRNKDSEKIKELEKELDSLKDIRRQNETLEKKSLKNEKRYHDERKKREEFEKQVDLLSYQL